MFIIFAYLFRNGLQELLSGTTNKDEFPFYLFIILSAVLTVLAFIKNLSLIPVLGLLSCFYLMTQLGYTNWLRFLVWLIIGLDILHSHYSYEAQLYLGMKIRHGITLFKRISFYRGAIFY